MAGHDQILPNLRDGSDLVIRSMRDEPAEYERMVTWRNRPHVREWWDPDDPSLDLAGAIEEYRGDTQPGAPTTACVIEIKDEPAGYVQFYRWNDYGSGAREIGFNPGSDWWGFEYSSASPT